MRVVFITDASCLHSLIDIPKWLGKVYLSPCICIRKLMLSLLSKLFVSRVIGSIAPIISVFVCIIGYIALICIYVYELTLNQTA